jgi:hypothetical protein
MARAIRPSLHDVLSAIDGIEHAMPTPKILIHSKGGFTIAEIVGDGILLRNADDGRDLLMQSRRADWVAVHEKNIAPEFFDLRSGVAGEVLQKFVNYQGRLAIIGDISRYTQQSEALAALVRESNRGRDTRFVATLDQLAG